MRLRPISLLAVLVLITMFGVTSAPAQLPNSINPPPIGHHCSVPGYGTFPLLYGPAYIGITCTVQVPTQNGPQWMNGTVVQ
jgi:hypothetical protein